MGPGIANGGCIDGFKSLRRSLWIVIVVFQERIEGVGGKAGTAVAIEWFGCVIFVGFYEQIVVVVEAVPLQQPETRSASGLRSFGRVGGTERALRDSD